MSGPGGVSRDDGFRVLDGVALVLGAAVGSVHLRPLMAQEMTALGLVLAWGVFSGIVVTAAGPFLFVLRRFVTRVPGYPRLGDGLWAVLGLPWLLTALVRSFTSDVTGPTGRDAGFELLLNGCLAVVVLIALAVIWGTWVTVRPEEAAKTAAPSWTNRIGLGLAIAWPVQCGLGMIVTG